MNRWANKFFVFLLAPLCLLAQPAGMLQKKNELESRKKALQQEIADFNRQLESTKKNKRLSMTQLVQLNKKIEKRKELIATINRELSITGKAIDNNVKDINDLSVQISQLKKQYAKMVSSDYLMRYGNSGWAFLVSAKDLNQGVKRAVWMKQISDERMAQARLIDQKTQQLSLQVKSLEARRADQALLLDEKEKEKEVLDKEKDQQQETLSKLQKKEKDIKKQIRKKQDEAQKLNLAIMRIIDDEIRKARDEAASATRKKSDKTKNNKGKETHAEKSSKNSTPAKESADKKESLSTIELLNISPESQQLSANFETNRHRLPWPVASGSVISSFGEHEHPLLKGIKIKNNGVNIIPGRDNRTQSVFDGEITGIVSIPGAGKAVIIRHGEYLTVYGNLSEVYVSKGERVKARQNLGLVMNNEENKPELHFELWRGTQTLDPQEWLIRK